MNEVALIAFTSILMALAVVASHAQDMPPAVKVTTENYCRAETDVVFANDTRVNKSLGQFHHQRSPATLDKQVVPRMNRDTLYSSAIFDLDAGPVTITMPDAGKRFMSLMVIDEDHYVHAVYYGTGSYTLTKKAIGTRYILAGLRTLADPRDQADLEKAHALQDAVKINQPGGPGTFEVPNWDLSSLKKIHDALLVLNESLPDLKHAFGTKSEVDSIRHLIVTASAWGGNPDKDAIYLNVTPPNNDGQTVYRLNVKNVPVDGFWSVTVYNEKGMLEPNPQDMYSINGITGKKDADGSVTIQFGGDAATTTNYLPIRPGWNYMVRFYRPRAEILSGNWKFPDPQPASKS